jgi:hypothetical protein
MKEIAIYFDTDSVNYLQNIGKLPGVRCGDNLGDMTNETVPDEYAYKIVNSTNNEKKTVCKVREKTLKYAAAHLVKFNSTGTSY